MKIGHLAAILIALTTAAASAQPQDAPASQQPRVWTAETPAGTYTVRLSTITSVSTHEYLVDATAKVTELTIATTGSEIARFYHISPVTPSIPSPLGQSGVNMVSDKLKETADRGAGEWQKVVKNYPMTTHAHTIEYRVNSRETLLQIYKSAHKAWTEDRTDSIKP